MATTAVQPQADPLQNEILKEFILQQIQKQIAEYQFSTKPVPETIQKSENLTSLEESIRKLIDIQNNTLQQLELMREEIKQNGTNIQLLQQNMQHLREEMNQRFEQTEKQNQLLRNEMNQRFEQTEKQIQLLRKEMNQRFEQNEKEMKQRFEQAEKQNQTLREDMNKRFNMLLIFMGIGTTIICALIGGALQIFGA